MAVTLKALDWRQTETTDPSSACQPLLDLFDHKSRSFSPVPTTFQ